MNHEKQLQLPVVVEHTIVSALIVFSAHYLLRVRTLRA